jgi:hypothetical protein
VGRPGWPDGRALSRRDAWVRAHGGRLGEEPRPKLVVADTVGDRLDDAPGLAEQIRRRLVVPLTGREPSQLGEDLPLDPPAPHTLRLRPRFLNLDAAPTSTRVLEVAESGDEIRRIIWRKYPASIAVETWGIYSDRGPDQGFPSYPVWLVLNPETVPMMADGSLLRSG